MDFLLCIVLGVRKTHQQDNDREHTMSNFIQVGAMAVQFLAEGTHIEFGGEFYTVAFVDDCFAYSRDLAEYNVFHTFARDDSGKLHKIVAYRDTMFPLFEEVTAEEFAAATS